MLPLSALPAAACCWLLAVGQWWFDPRPEGVHHVKGLRVAVFSSASWSAYLRGPSPSRDREKNSEVPIDAHDFAMIVHVADLLSVDGVDGYSSTAVADARQLLSFRKEIFRPVYHPSFFILSLPA